MMQHIGAENEGTVAAFAWGRAIAKAAILVVISACRTIPTGSVLQGAPAIPCDQELVLQCHAPLVDGCYQPSPRTTLEHLCVEPVQVGYGSVGCEQKLVLACKEPFIDGCLLQGFDRTAVHLCVHPDHQGRGDGRPCIEEASLVCAPPYVDGCYLEGADVTVTHTCVQPGLDTLISCQNTGNEAGWDAAVKSTDIAAEFLVELRRHGGAVPLREPVPISFQKTAQGKIAQDGSTKLVFAQGSIAVTKLANQSLQGELKFMSDGQTYILSCKKLR